MPAARWGRGCPFAPPPVGCGEKKAQVLRHLNAFFSPHPTGSGGERTKNSPSSRQHLQSIRISSLGLLAANTVPAPVGGDRSAAFAVRQESYPFPAHTANCELTQGELFGVPNVNVNGTRTRSSAFRPSGVLLTSGRYTWYPSRNWGQGNPSQVRGPSSVGPRGRGAVARDLPRPNGRGSPLAPQPPKGGRSSGSGFTPTTS